jgi:16S rRNA (uracil1498-N3)-methyltransferase
VSLPRRIHVERLDAGEIELDEKSAHHIARVLRLGAGAEIELFDAAGSVASATIVSVEPGGRVIVRVGEIGRVSGNVSEITIASAVTKGERADWMVEKLSELGCARWIPLATARSVVLPEGRNKRERWMRIAMESAKQSRRAGVMRVDELTQLDHAVRENAETNAFHLSTQAGAREISEALRTRPASRADKWAFFIGPEGGWTSEEIELFTKSNIAALKLTDTVLRVETAAIATAAVAATMLASNPSSPI